MTVISELAKRHGVSEMLAADIYAAGKAAGRNERISSRPNAGDLHQQLSLDCYRRAYDAGMSLSAWLEREDPSENYADGMDAFQRQLYLAGVRTRSDSRLGLWANTVGELYDATPTSAVLFPEWLARTWREASGMQRFYMSTSPVSDALFPGYIEAEIRAKQLQPSILNDLIAVRTGIDQATYQAFYLTESAASERMVRVTEGADLPVATLTGGDHTIRLKSYGRTLKISYSDMRRMQLDLLAFHIQRMAQRTDKDKALQAIKTAAEGDGNSNDVTTLSYTYSISGLTEGVANQIDLAPWLDFLMKFEDPYTPNIVVAQAEGIIAILTLDAGTGNFMVYINQAMNQAALGGFTMPEAPLGPARFYSRSFMESKKVVALDNRFALQMVTEIGSDLVETDKLIQAQFNVVTMSEVVGFVKLDNEAVRELNWGA